MKLRAYFLSIALRVSPLRGTKLEIVKRYSLARHLDPDEGTAITDELLLEAES